MTGLICAKCGLKAKEITIGKYEYVKGISLSGVKAFECQKCREFIFTPEQVEEMEARTDLIKSHSFAFQRKVTVSGRSLSINIPEDLARHLHVLKGKSVKLITIDDRRFMVETVP